MSISDKLKNRKSAGNRHFLFKEFVKAGKCYSNAIKFAEHYFSSKLDADYKNETINNVLINNSNVNEHVSQSSSEIEEDLRTLYIDCLNNIAVCFLNLKQFTKAKEACIRILEVTDNKFTFKYFVIL
jgi:tetratricopeptide (TPR) repeat protein